ncbi:unnamed protein product [Effrenium voratum]|nr:unnamed protein product [Effrenium voratum]
MQGALAQRRARVEQQEVWEGYGRDDVPSFPEDDQHRHRDWASQNATKLKIASPLDSPRGLGGAEDSGAVPPMSEMAEASEEVRPRICGTRRPERLEEPDQEMWEPFATPSRTIRGGSMSSAIDQDSDVFQTPLSTSEVTPAATPPELDAERERHMYVQGYPEIAMPQARLPAMQAVMAVKAVLAVQAAGSAHTLRRVYQDPGDLGPEPKPEPDTASAGLEVAQADAAGVPDSQSECTQAGAPSDEAADVGPKAEAPHRLATEASFYSCASSASDSNQPETEPGGSLAVNSPQDSSGEEADSRLVDQLLHSVEVTSPKAEVVRDAGAGTQVAELEQRAREAKAAEQPTQSGQSVADSEQPEAEGEQTDSAEPESRVARAGSTASATEHFDIGSDIEKESSNASSFLERIGFSRGQQSAGSILTVPEHPVSVEHYLISSDAEHNDGQDGSLSSRSVEKLDLPELPDPEQAAEMHRRATPRGSWQSSMPPKFVLVQM